MAGQGMAIYSMVGSVSGWHRLARALGQGLGDGTNLFI